MTWTVYARDPQLNRVGQIDDFSKLEMVQKFNDVGTWVLEMDGRAPLAALLTTPGYGIEVVRHDAGTVTSVLGGPMRLRQKSLKADSSRLLLGGYDDNVWLRRRWAAPQPTTAAPPYSVQAYDVRTGTCSTILRQYVDLNAGPSALAVRRVPGLALAADPGAGSSVTGRARWQILIDLLRELALAGGGLGFAVTPSSSTPGQIDFRVYSPADKTDTVRFSRELGTLAEADYESAAAAVSFVAVGGSGEGTARAVVERPNSDEVGTWGRIESFVDRRDTNDLVELGQAADEALADGVGETRLSLVPVDVVGQQYLTHYTLGDRVTAVIDGEVIQEVVREVRISLGPDGPTTNPTVGTPGAGDVNRLFRRLAAAERGLRDLERR